MNRQVVAFLSLFSLVLVLSIYYVMIPYAAKNTTNSSENSTLVTATIEDSVESYFASLALERDQRHQDYIKSQEDIVASASDYSAEQIEVALNNISNERNIMENEQICETSIKGIGYSSVFVEVKQTYINCIAHKESPTEVDAANIITTIQNCLEIETNVVVQFRD